MPKIPLEWKASITGTEDVKRRLQEIRKEYQEGSIGIQEYGDKNRFLIGTLRKSTTTYAQQRSILRATHPSYETITRSVSTFGRVMRATLSIVNAFNIANLVTQQSTQRIRDAEIELIDAQKELINLQETLSEDDPRLALQKQKVDELKGSVEALNKEFEDQKINNWITALSGIGVAISTTFTALTSNPKIANALFTAASRMGTLFGGVFTGFATLIMRAGTWISTALLPQGKSGIYWKSGLTAGTRFGGAFIAGTIIGLAALGAVMASILIPEVEKMLSKFNEGRAKESGQVINAPGSDFVTKDEHLKRSALASQKFVDDVLGFFQPLVDLFTVGLPNAYAENEAASEESMVNQLDITQRGVDIITNAYNSLSKGVISSINNMIANYNRVAEKTGRPRLARARDHTIERTEVGSIRGAAGFEGITSGLTTFTAGEAGKEHVSISPVGQSSKSKGGITVIQHITVHGSILAERDIERISDNALKKKLKRLGF